MAKGRTSDVKMDDTNMPFDEYDNRISLALGSLGITGDDVARTGLPLQREPVVLSVAEQGEDGMEHCLIPQAAAAWKDMKAAAREEGIALYIVSAFRDLDSQTAIVREKIERGMPLPTIFRLSAPPGYSEHHTGRAIDINTPGCIPREIPFEQTAAFQWLVDNAARHGFVLSYPRDNALGFSYEPWHWYYVPQ